MKSKQNYSDDNLLVYKENLDPILTSDFENTPNLNQETILDKMGVYGLNLEMWEKINKLDAFSKRIMYLKYDNEFNKIRSNKIIGELMCCSEENIRQNLRKTLQKIQ
jgi:DNA-directed RNA polymerase sigma subunit (sigma70/sigma32)